MANRIGVCEWCLPVTGPYGVTLAGKAGFEGIQLGDLGGIAAGFPMNRKSVQEGYMQAAADAGVALQAIHPYGLQRQGTMLTTRDMPGWEDSRRSLKMCIDACLDMNVPELMVSSFFNTMINNDRELRVYAEHLNYACDLGEDKGVVISYESALTLPQIDQMMELTRGRMKVCYDVRNPIELGCGQPAEDILALGAEHIAHIHIKDFPADMKNWCLIGDGIAQIDEIKKIIDSTGYTGWFVSENDYGFLAAQADCDFLIPAAEDARRMRKLFCL